MALSSDDGVPFWRDKRVLTIVAVGLILRLLPLISWPDMGCVRDECTYIGLVRRFIKGEGMTTSAGWLWAPGYPVLMALFKKVFGYASTIKGLQVVAAGASTLMVYALAIKALGGPDEDRQVTRKRARLAAWMYALSPSLIFFTVRLWSEVLYGALLLGGLLLFQSARDQFQKVDGARAIRASALVGALVGCCVLFRGVATYMLPIFLFALVWRRWTRPRAWAQVAALSVAAVVMVGPYSAYATKKFETFIVSDRTLGQMMWLGNNDFAPITFDYGNGQLSKRAFNRAASLGRKPCGKRKKAIERDACQTEAGVDWIKENPEEFVRRMPLRVAQLLTPHSLLTRHLRWGKWKGLPQSIDEGIIVLGALSTMVAIWIGALGLVARGRRGLGVLIAGILVYHCAAIAVLAGLSRYRIPLEPLVMVYSTVWLVEPRQTLARLRQSPWRWGLMALVVIVVTPLMLWHLPSGWVWWREW